MSFLDEVFKNPFPNVMVNRALFSLYVSQSVAVAQAEQWSEAQLSERLQSLPDYRAFLVEFEEGISEELKHLDESQASFSDN